MALNVNQIRPIEEDPSSSLQKASSVNPPFYELKLSEVDTQKKQREFIFTHTFSDTQSSSLFRQLHTASELPSADQSTQIPIACYQAMLSQMNENSFSLEVVILWKDSLEIPTFSQLQDPALLVFAEYALQESYELPETGPERNEISQKTLASARVWSPREFYSSVHVPPNTDDNSADIKCPDLHCTLFPFQRRAVRWLLQRESMNLQPDGSVTPTQRAPSDNLPVSFKQMCDADGQVCYYSHLCMTITSDISQWSDAGDRLKGGILAEEMGLGKTVEIIALINLNRRPAQIRPDPDGLVVSGATLIITPPAILEQWQREIQQHSPNLRIHNYTGIQRGEEKSDNLVAEELAEYDVVLTTYKVIGNELHYSGTAPDRNLRHAKRFEPRKTPLIRISWWRVCLDEAQMIESGVSNAAQVARLIPRVNAWAVTGTPLRRDIEDLFGLLLFLHYDPFCHSKPLWKRLYSMFGPILKQVIQKTALRHSKDRVRDELRLPPQKRVIVTASFNSIEEHHYRQLYQQMCGECGLDAEGAPLHDDWNPEDPRTVELMHTWLTRLRQTCLHPEVSGHNRRVLGTGNGPLLTVGEVLEVMIEKNDTSIRSHERMLLQSQLRRGQLLENAKRREEALALWQAALDHSTRLVEDSREELRLQENLLKRAPRETTRDGSEANDDESDETDKNSRIGQCRSKLRMALEVQHIAVFFTANAYYQIKSDPALTQPDSEDFKSLGMKEEQGYETAKMIRQEMLVDISRKVERYMTTIKGKVQKKQFVQIPKMKPHTQHRGLESRRIFDRFEDLCTALNVHAEKYNEWRNVMTKLVSQPLIDQEDDAELEGDEYERSTKHQDEMYVYMEALRAMYADRHDCLTGQKNDLIARDVRTGILQARIDQGPSPKLFLSVMEERSTLIPSSDLGSLRGIVSELRSLTNPLDWQASGGSARARTELELVNQVLKHAGQVLSEQLKVSAKLEREVEMFRDTMNTRLEYYRALQQISDTVAPYDEENAGKPMDEALFASKVEAEEKLEQRISSFKTTRRYLIHLRDQSGSETDRICMICQSTYEDGMYLLEPPISMKLMSSIFPSHFLSWLLLKTSSLGFLTVCGHQYCKECFPIWWRLHRNCPTCKQKLKRRDLHQITYRPKGLSVREEESGIRHHPKNAIYSDISSGVLNQINNIVLDGSYGTKVDTLARHLIWLRHYDPGAKSIVFSQYKAFLKVLQTALAQYKIEYSSIDSRGGVESFNNDPAVSFIRFEVHP